MPRSVRSNPLAMAVLVCLYERPMHPYEVAQTLRQRAKQESVRLNYGSLYAVVESLEKRGLVKASGTIRQGRRPERTIYEITDDGSREMVDWLTELVSVPAKEFPQFMAGLSFIAALEPDDALRALRERSDGLAFKLAGLRGATEAARQAGLPRLFGLEAEYEEGQLLSELQFVKELVREIEEKTLDGLAMWHAFHEEGVNPSMQIHLESDPGAAELTGPAVESTQRREQ